MPKEILTVKITSGDNKGAEVSFNYDLPATLQEAIDQLSEPVVEALAIRSIVVAVQGHARGLLNSGKTEQEIQTAMNDWRPGMPRQVKSAEEKFDELWEKMSPEDRAAIQKRMKAAKAA
ncbi:MAG TPA: hypothetical protein VH621_03340 [Nitrososphaera sp.]|jgi:hypothetical protein